MNFEKMINIVNAHMKAFKKDFYDYDVSTLNNPEEQYYVWIVRTHGTHLIPKSLVASSDTLHYWINNEAGSGNDVNYYEIDTNTGDITKIMDIVDYASVCREEATLQDKYNSCDDFDIDY